jgi:hypothetical protein
MPMNPLLKTEPTETGLAALLARGRSWWHRLRRTLRYHPEKAYLRGRKGAATT